MASSQAAPNAPIAFVPFVLRILTGKAARYLLVLLIAE
jgi:membrane protein YqaA with SNARE-associated domain